MKKWTFFLLAAILAFPLSAGAEIIVLKGEEVVKAYNINDTLDGFEKDNREGKVYMVIEYSEDTPPDLNLENFTNIFYNKNEKKYKVIDPSDLTDPVLSMVILKGNKVAFTMRGALIEGDFTALVQGAGIGNINNKFKLKDLKEYIIVHNYRSGALTRIEKSKSNMVRDKKFSGDVLLDVVDQILDHLESKGYVDAALDE